MGWYSNFRISPPSLGVGVPGLKPQKSQKVLKKPSDPRAPKVWKKSRGESEKSRKIWFQTFFGLLGPEGPSAFSRLFRDFWGFGPETPPPRSTLTYNACQTLRKRSDPLQHSKDAPNPKFSQTPNLSKYFSWRLFFRVPVRDKDRKKTIN